MAALAAAALPAALAEIGSRFFTPSIAQSEALRNRGITCAHWIYLDEYRPMFEPNAPFSGPSYNKKQRLAFAKALHAHVPALAAIPCADFMASFKRYLAEEQSCARAGLVLVNRALTHILLIEPYVEVARAERTLALPKGKLDAGEVPFKAALREFYEETGISVTVDDLLPAPGAAPGAADTTDVYAYQQALSEQLERYVYKGAPTRSREVYYFAHGAPLVAATRPRCTGEVARVIWYPADALFNPKTRAAKGEIVPSKRLKAMTPWIKTVLTGLRADAGYEPRKAHVVVAYELDRAE